jgi:hypothetical protein
MSYVHDYLFVYNELMSFDDANKTAIDIAKIEGASPVLRSIVGAAIGSPFGKKYYDDDDELMKEVFRDQVAVELTYAKRYW